MGYRLIYIFVSRSGLLNLAQRPGLVVRQFISHALHRGDNGRVVGYDNQHGYHHRHFLGVVAPVVFTSFEDIESLFQADWTALRSKP